MESFVSFRHVTIVAFLAIVAVSSTGCSSHSGPEIGRVTGVVTLDGKPLKDAVVRFQPGTGRGSRAKTHEDGSYDLGYVGGQMGALVGEHKVSISTGWMDEVPGKGIVNHPETLPAKYNANSTLTQTVNSGKNEINFDLMSK